MKYVKEETIKAIDLIYFLEDCMQKKKEETEMLINELQEEEIIYYARNVLPNIYAVKKGMILLANIQAIKEFSKKYPQFVDAEVRSELKRRNIEI